MVLPRGMPVIAPSNAADFGGKARLFEATDGRVRAGPKSASSAGHRRRVAVAARYPGVLLFGSFLLDKQEKGTRAARRDVRKPLLSSKPPRPQEAPLTPTLSPIANGGEGARVRGKPNAVVPAAVVGASLLAIWVCDTRNIRTRDPRIRASEKRPLTPTLSPKRAWGRGGSGSCGSGLAREGILPCRKAYRGQGRSYKGRYRGGRHQAARDFSKAAIASACISR